MPVQTNIGNNKSEQELADRFYRLIVDRKLFLKHGIDLCIIAKLMKTNRSYLSRAINLSFGKSYVSFVNELRVRESIRLLQSKSGYTIDTIAGMCGFDHRGTFHRVFKKLMGQSPADFRAGVRTS